MLFENLYHGMNQQAFISIFIVSKQRPCILSYSDQLVKKDTGEMITNEEKNRLCRLVLNTKGHETQVACRDMNLTTDLS